jgi:hypothetical protein
VFGGRETEKLLDSFVEMHRVCAATQSELLQTQLTMLRMATQVSAPQLTYSLARERDTRYNYGGSYGGDRGGAGL